MIIKKPYAFLIKKFRLIHGFLFLLLLYLTIKLFSIYTFFNNYAIDHYYFNTGTLDSTYINAFMFIFSIIAILISVVIYYLLYKKGKSNKLYLYLSVYEVLIVIYFMFMLNTFQGLNKLPIDVETVRVYRDISLIILIPQLIFTVIILSRSLGFNIKQFEFKKDLEELSIDSTDNEEIELSVENKSYKITRYFRKLIRLFKYFIIENKLFVIILSSIVVFSISVAVFINIKIYNVEYHEKINLLANSLWYKVNSSYITTKDINNNDISKNKAYIIVDLSIENRLNNEYLLSRDTFRLEVNDELLFPVFSYKDKFKDFGDVFSPKTIKQDSKLNQIIVFEIDKKYIDQSYVFKIKNYNNKSLGELQSLYKDIKINPTNLDNYKSDKEYKLSEKINFNKTILKNTNLVITDYSISNKFNEKYQKCDKDVCDEITYVVSPNNVGKGNLSVLKLNTNLELDKDLNVNSFIKNVGDLIGYYGFISYHYLNENKIINIQNINVKYNNDSISYFEIPSEVKNADKINLILLIRGIKYTIILK